MKTKVIEPVAGAFKFSSESQMQYHGEMAIRRFVETEELIKQGRLDDTREEQVGNLLFAHTEMFNKSFDSSTEKVKAREILADLEHGVSQHEKLLLSIDYDLGGEVEPKNEHSKRKTPDTVLKKVEKVKDSLKHDEEASKKL